MKKLKSTLLLIASTTLLLAACGTETAPSEQNRGPLRGLKADAGFSCQGTCGEQAPGGCWCDEQCARFGDCCPDKGTTCDKRSVASCQGACGGQSADGCWCDAGCALSGDCCADVTELCPKEKTCAEAGGTCAALTAEGVLCTEGYTLQADAGSCAVGTGCCMPIAL